MMDPFLVSMANLSKAVEVKKKYVAELMAIPEVVGVGIGF